MPLSLPGSFVTTQWLATHPDLVIRDGSFKPPDVTPIAAEDFATRHIPGPRFCDIDAVADHGSSLPDMLPSTTDFEHHASDLGIFNDSVVVVYDTPGLMSAGRVWWTLHVFGHDNVAVLDGGLKKCLAEGRPVTTEVTTPVKTSFNAAFDPAAVRSKAQVLSNLQSRAEQVIDARSAGRFTAEEKEARPGLRRMCQSSPMAGTSLEGHLTAVRGGVSIDLSRIARIIRVSPEDLDCTVEAGVTREQLNTHLRDLGLFFPIDPANQAEFEEVAGINKKMVQYAISVGGTSTGEHGVGTGKIAYLWQEHGDAIDLMAAIKSAIAPKGIMNPRKILPQ